MLYALIVCYMILAAFLVAMYPHAVEFCSVTLARSTPGLARVCAVCSPEQPAYVWALVRQQEFTTHLYFGEQVALSMISVSFSRCPSGSSWRADHSEQQVHSQELHTVHRRMRSSEILHA